MNNDNLEWLQEWYKSQCDGEWEHLGHKIRIETIDNPGWSVSIEIFETNLEKKPFETMEIERTPLNWIYCTVQKYRFEGRCGPLNLAEILTIFRNWVESK